MSLDNLKEFGRLCKEDDAVKAKVKEIGVNNTDELIAYAGKELNLDFSLDDMKTLAKETGSSNEELNEEDLEKIAGGVWTVTADDDGFLVVK